MRHKNKYYMNTKHILKYSRGVMSDPFYIIAVLCIKIKVHFN